MNFKIRRLIGMLTEFQVCVVLIMNKTRREVSITDLLKTTRRNLFHF
jgi:transcriptional regulator